jgi:hypothetical protein
VKKIYHVPDVRALKARPLLDLAGTGIAAKLLDVTIKITKHGGTEIAI